MAKGGGHFVIKVIRLPRLSGTVTFRAGSEILVIQLLINIIPFGRNIFLSQSARLTGERR